MNKVTKLLASAAFALIAAPASAVTISTSGGSITLSDGLTFMVSSVFENIVLAPGQTLSGVGEISQINGAATASFCSSACELTFSFTGYIATTVTATSATFTGGTFNVFLGFGANNDFNPFLSTGSAADLAAATNGTLFLTLAGHPIDAAGNTLAASATAGGFTTGDFAFFGQGQLDVVPGGGGAANANFDTNTIPSAFPSALGANADLSFTTSGNTLGEPHPAECLPSPGLGPECVAGSADIRAFVVPEPGALALLGLALSLLGGGLIRRRAS